jgi:hypothetical protein
LLHGSGVLLLLAGQLSPEIGEELGARRRFDPAKLKEDQHADQQQGYGNQQ